MIIYMTLTQKVYKRKKSTRSQLTTFDFSILKTCVTIINLANDACSLETEKSGFFRTKLLYY